MTRPTANHGQPANLAEYVDELLATHGQRLAVYGIDRGRGIEIVKIRQNLQDSLVIVSHDASVGPEIVHHAQIRTIYPMGPARD